MSQLGIGVVLNRLSGGPSATADRIRSAIGATIAGVVLDAPPTRDLGYVRGHTHLRISLAGHDDQPARTLILSDCGQACCEERYLTCDDDLASFAGAVLVDIDIRDVTSPVPDDPDGYVHEVQFLVVTTSKGAITVAAHDVHNGYYGGISIDAFINEDGS